MQYLLSIIHGRSLKFLFRNFSVPAWTLGFASLSAYQILAQVVGFNLWSPFVFQSIVLCALLVGFMPVRKTVLDSEANQLLLVVFVFLVGCFWGPIVSLTAQFLNFKILWVATLLWTLISVFRFANLDLHRDGPVLGQWYGLFHIQALFGFLAAVFIDELFAKAFGFCLFAVFIVLIRFSSQASSAMNILSKTNFGPGSITHRKILFSFVGLSLISGFQSVWLWQVIHHTVRTTGWEFSLWQAVAFCALGVAPLLAAQFKSLFRAVVFWMGALMMIPGLMVLLPWLPFSLPTAVINVCCFVLLCGFPMFAAALLLPLVEAVFKGRWLWWSIVGNSLGLVLGLCAALFLDRQWLGLPVVFGLGLFCVLAANSLKAIVFSLILSAGLFSLVRSMNDKTFIAASQAISGYNSEDSSSSSLSITANGQHAILRDIQGGDSELWLNSYLTRVGGLREVHQALFGEPNLSRGGQKILVLGLGNTNLVSAVQRMLSGLQVEEYQLDVVENFAPLLQPALQNALAIKTGFRPDDKQMKIHAADAFEFLHQSLPLYDLVLWNLSHPFGASSSRMYTVETLQRIQKLLGSSGSFVAFLDPVMISKPELACLYRKVFANGRFFPSFDGSTAGSRHYFVVDRSSVSWPTMAKGLEHYPCEKIDVPSLAKNSLERSMAFYQDYAIDVQQLYGPSSLKVAPDVVVSELPVAVRWSLLQAGWGHPWLISGNSLNRMSALRATKVASLLPAPSEVYHVNAGIESGNPLQVYETELIKIRPQLDVVKPPELHIERHSRDALLDCSAVFIHRQLFRSEPTFDFTYYLSKIMSVDFQERFSSMQGACPTAGNGGDLHFTDLPDKPKSIIFKNTLQLWRDQKTFFNFSDRWNIAPCSSVQIPDFVKNIKNFDSMAKWINCVTALEKFDSDYNQVSMFPGASQFLQGVLHRLMDSIGKPKRVFILHDPDSIYLQDSLDSLTMSILAQWPDVSVVVHRLDRRGDFQFEETDWVIIWSTSGPYELRAEALKGYDRAHKIFIYGRPDADDFGKSIPRSTQVLFWHPAVSYDPVGLNCKFSLQFEKRFGQVPDFHAAYLWANLEMAGGQKMTILGHSEIGPQGRQQFYRPILFHRPDDGPGYWDLMSDQRYFCRQRGRPDF